MFSSVSKVFSPTRRDGTRSLLHNTTHQVYVQSPRRPVLETVWHAEWYASGINLRGGVYDWAGRCHSLCKCPSVYEETPPVTSTPLARGRNDALEISSPPPPLPPHHLSPRILRRDLLRTPSCQGDRVLESHVRITRDTLRCLAH